MSSRVRTNASGIQLVDPKKKNIILAIVVVVLIGGAVLALFRDALFTPAPEVSKADTQASAVVGAAVGGTDGQAAPDSPNPPPRGGSA